jgi:DNA-binding FadR family transcriptional regulator
MVSKMFYELRQDRIDVAKDLRLAAEEHRAIYQAIRAGDPARARAAMGDHLHRSAAAQAQEDNGFTVTPDRATSKEHE